MTLVLDAAAVARLLSRIDTLSEMRALFSRLGEGAAVQPPQTLTLLPHGRGDFITYLGAMPETFGAKLSPYLPQEGGPLITAWTLLMSMQTGEPLLLCDASRLTQERTAGTTALAVDLLAPADAARLAIIGSGAVGLAHWRHVAPLRAWAGVRVFSPGLGGDGLRAARWREAGVTLAANAAEAVHGADVVMLCTSSGTPVIDPALCAPGALVTSISTNAPDAHEVPPAFLTEAEVYCDYRATTPATAGEMRLAARDHGWSAAVVRGDLAELMTGRAPLPSGTRRTYFRSVGLGLEDIAMAEALFRVATEGKNQ
ncbi:ornithine cyclodeaminase family protein [Haematobacter missouriensis]|uniref:Ornithine cyclodeaminase n=1 Tax=Haematobacter missouriensis TaxID=366616 RepID=A0A212AI81_9RHOB|nr:ornithine cyclodeaminase family protein [Haematobacter missouriensis]OWJ77786.1 ornithine cyclodeaminase [Haematobacter missouriensis]OWJ81222.1 ornithine cyclodeaminase [Haematobacter missouriensis]